MRSIRFAQLLLLLCSGTSVGAEPSPPKPLDPKILSLIPEDLRWRPPAVAPEKDAFLLWKEAGEKAVKPEDRGAVVDALEEDAELPDPGSEAGRKLEAWIEANRPALDLLEAGLRRGGFRLPDEVIRGPWPGFSGLARDLLEAKLLRAKRLADQGKHAEAAAEIEGVLRVSALVQKGGGGLFRSMSVEAAAGLGCWVIRFLAARKAVPDEVLKRLLDALGTPAEEAERFIDGRRAALCVSDLPPIAERCAGKEKLEAIIDLVAEGTEGEERAGVERCLRGLLEGHPRPFDLADTVRLACKAAGEMVKAGRSWKDRPTGLPDDLKACDDVWPTFSWRLAGYTSRAPEPLPAEDVEAGRKTYARFSNPLGRAIVSLHLAGFEFALKRHFMNRTEREATRAILALRLYEAKMGIIPKSLDALVAAKILRATPRDPYSGKLFGYSPARRLLWSVGPDGEEKGEEGLRDENGERRAYVWQVPSPR